MTSHSPRIFIAGHKGMVGGAIMRALLAQGCPAENILTRSHAELDLTEQIAVRQFFNQEQPTQVYLAAAKVGGIHANKQYPADFIYDNLMIEANIIQSAFRAGVDRLLFLGSSCIYPRLARQPMTEDELLSGKLEPTNEPYAIAKIAGIKLCESYYRQHGSDYRSLMPTNLYGPNDNYHPENSHVIPALIRKFHLAKIHNQTRVTLWGSGKPRREFLYVDDLARACLQLMSLDKTTYWQAVSPMQSHLNVGSGTDITIAELAKQVADTIGYKGEIAFDTSQPDGPMQKWIDSSALQQLGWQAHINLAEGLSLAYQDFLKHHAPNL